MTKISFQDQSVNNPIPHPNTIEQLIERANPTTPEDESTFREFVQHFRHNPELPPFLLRQFKRMRRKFGRVVFDWAWNAAQLELDTLSPQRSKATLADIGEVERRDEDADQEVSLVLPAALKSFYCRAMLLCHPEFIGLLRVKYTAADRVFGLTLAPRKQRGDHGRRLLWEDGTPIKRQRKAQPRKPVQSVPIAALAVQSEVQSELLGEVA
jgi:hypothetical protein